MASFQKIKKNTYKIRAYIGRDESGKQIVQYRNWHAPDGLSEAKEKRLLLREAQEWEISLQKEYEESQKKEAVVIWTLERFVREIWLPLCVYDGHHKPSTVRMYEEFVEPVLENFGERDIQSIQSIEIQEFFVYLTTKKRNYRGQKLAPTSIEHIYTMMAMIFKFANFAANSWDFSFSPFNSKITKSAASFSVIIPVSLALLKDVVRAFLTASPSISSSSMRRNSSTLWKG